MYDDNSILGSLAPQQQGMGGLLGALTSDDKLPYLAMIAKGLNPWSDLDPLAMMKIAQAKKEHALDRALRLQQLELSKRAQDRADQDAERPQYITRPDGSIVAVPRRGGDPTEVLPGIKQLNQTDAAQAARDMDLQPGTPEYKDFITSWYKKKTMGDDKPIPAEVSGRLALADTYLRKAPKIGEEIDKGSLTGPIDVTMGKLGIGSQGSTMGDVKSGVDALRRMLTGAGMPAAEANEYVQRYEPTYTDTTTTLRKKHDRLVEELTGMRDNIMRGRGSAPSPSSQVTPQGYTPSSGGPRLRYNPKTGELE